MTDKTQEDIMERIDFLIREIASIRSKFNRGQGGYNSAVALQRAKTEYEALRKQLDELRLVWSHPFPDTLPELLKRTRNEVREFLNLPPVYD